VILSGLLGLLLWYWSRRIYGDWAGLLTLFLYSLSPIVLANAGLATPDILLALTTTAALYLFQNYLKQPSRKGLCLGGVMLGLALLSKFTGLILIPTFLFLLIIQMRRRGSVGLRQTSRWQPLAGLGGIFFIAFLVIWAGYGFQYGAPFIPEWLQPQAGRLVQEKPFWRAASLLMEKGIKLPAYSYVLGIYTQLAAAKSWRNNFLFGQISENGWWYFYWLAFLIKNTLPFLACLAMGLLARRRLASENDDERFVLYSMVPMVLLFSLPTKINIGIRYILPLFPLLCVIAGRAASIKKLKWRYILAVLCVWQVGSIAWIHPHYLAYFNELIGGPSNGYKYLVDSNLDWGQELERLADYLKKNEVDDAKIQYFGPPGVLKYYGLKNVKSTNCKPSPGVWAVSATSLQGVYLDEPERFEWLRKLRPERIIGYSIFIYDVTKEDLENTGRDNR
jgi:4-amino-4-deoxy-L-arabinose transferase-like glycosyltransferase